MALFASVFALIFLAELPDKTSIANVILATRYRPFAVFLGSALAFMVQSAVAVAFGRVIATISPAIVHRVAGFLFVLFAILFFRKVEEDEDLPDEQMTSDLNNRFWRDAAISFVTIFMAEWGDLTQLATATLAAKYASPILIFGSSTLALWSVTGVGVIIGHRGRHAINPKLLRWIAAAAFFIAGVWLIVRG